MKRQQLKCVENNGVKTSCEEMKTHSCTLDCPSVEDYQQLITKVLVDTDTVT